MNPYEVLGVNPSDDEETIKKAYRNLVKKYHPDRYAGSPLAEEASEKLKEINLAYDIITGKSQPQSNTSGGYSGYSGSYSQNMPPSFQNVRALITMRMLDSALKMLSSLPQNAEWHYLTGVIYMNKGWYEKAREHIERAVAMESENIEYQNALNGFSRRAHTYTSHGLNISPLACCLANLCCANFCGFRYLPCIFCC